MMFMVPAVTSNVAHADDCFYCGTNKKYYDDSGVCFRECKVSIAHFTDICMPTANQCPTPVATPPLPDPDKGMGPCDCDCVGNPISLGCGNKFEEVTDYTTVGPNRLSYTRYYNSIGSSNARGSSLGQHWRSTYDRVLRVTTTGGSPSLVMAERSSGQALRLTLRDGHWTSDSDIDLRLTQAGSTWTLIDDSDSSETYTVSDSGIGLLTVIQARNGYRQSLAYDNSGHLLNVTDSFGRKLALTYDDDLVRTVTTPDGLILTYGYTVSGASGPKVDRLASVSYSTNPVTRQVYLYEDAALPFALTALIDENRKRFATWTYDPQGRALSSQHAGGVELTTIAYNDSDSSRTVTNALGGKTVYRFAILQGVPKLVSMERAATQTMPAAARKIGYDDNGYIASQTDWAGNLTTYINDGRGRPISITEGAGTPEARTTKISWSGAFNLPTKITTSLLTRRLEYDLGGNLVRRIEIDTTMKDGIRRSWSYEWSNGLLVSVSGPRTDVTQITRFAYDDSGAVIKITNALGQVTQITKHLPGGLPLKTVDANGVEVDLAYDRRSRLVERTVTTKGGSWTDRFTFDAAGNRLSVALPDGSRLDSVYDAAHRVFGIRNSIGERIEFFLDALGDRTKISIATINDAVVRELRANFDELGRSRARDVGEGEIAAYAYDANGKVQTVTSPGGRVLQRTIDALGRTTSVTNAVRGITAFQYGESDLPTTVTDPRQNITKFLYDGFGDVIQQISPDTGITRFLYDEAGNLVSSIDAGGKTAIYAYDALDRLISKTYPAGVVDDVSFHYDDANSQFGIGRLTSVVDGAGKLERAYDERGNLIRETRLHGPLVLMTTYEYDAANRLKGIRYPSGWMVHYGRDGVGRVIAITGELAQAAAAVPLILSASYEPFGPLTTLTYGNGLTESWIRDKAYRPLRFTVKGDHELANLTYRYNETGDVASISDALNSADDQTFHYDILGRLVDAYGAYGSLAYTYDSAGNRVRERDSVVGDTSFQYSKTSNQLLFLQHGDDRRSFVYSSAGNLALIKSTTGESWSFIDNEVGQLAGVVLNGKILGQYTYDGFGRRFSKTVGPGQSDESFFNYDTQMLPIEEADQADQSVIDYVYLGKKPVALRRAAGSIELRSVHTDHIGAPLFESDHNQAVAWIAKYKPFGQAEVYQRDVGQEIRLPGQFADLESGLYQNGYRYYNPAWGRYIEPDPLGLLGGLNAYAYANSNPINLSDPLGLDIWIEGPSGTPSVLASLTKGGEPYFHQSLNIGDPFGTYVDLTNMGGVELSDALSNVGLGTYISVSFAINNGGTVYSDQKQGGPIVSYFPTTPTQDQIAAQYLMETGAEDNRGWYSPWNTCRTYSQSKFNFLANLFGVSPSDAPFSRPTSPSTFPQGLINAASGASSFTPD